jgi:hypothetical protein
LIACTSILPQRIGQNRRPPVVLYVGVGIGAAPENGLARHLDDAAAVAWPEPIHLAGDEGFHPLDFAARQGSELGYLDAPGNAHLHGRVLDRR